jgi:hypothetical protein
MMALREMREHLNEIEHHLIEKDWEAARTHVSDLIQGLEGLIDSIDKGRIE